MSKEIINKYKHELIKVADSISVPDVELVCQEIYDLWQRSGSVYICGNGGSAANAMHIANDFIYGVRPNNKAVDIEALSSNSAILTCLGNDVDFSEIYSKQLVVKGQPDDILIVLTGSGNSENIIKAVKQAKTMAMTTIAIVGFDGGAVKKMVDYCIHFDIDDMQISEDMQLVAGHIIMKILKKKIIEAT